VEEIKKIIKEEVEKRGVKILRMLLFGSRARGNYKPDSDWDIFVIIDKKLSFAEKWDIIDDIKTRLARLHIRNVIILKSEEEVKESKDNVGAATYYALKDGIEV
jgi:predicted nucleotidyltransferase